MLLDFKAVNYKSFRDELKFSMIPAPKQKGLDYSVLEAKIGRKKYNALSTAVIYGPNAAGKTNIIGAMDTFRRIVLRGHIRNDGDESYVNTAANRLELIPNNLSETRTPVAFSVRFIEKNLCVEYGFTVDLGFFLEDDYPRKIHEERLTVNDEMIFSRNDELEIGSLNVIQNMLIRSFKQNESSIISVAQNNLNDEELFLLNGFKAMFSAELVGLITHWLERKFLIIYRADKMQFDPKLTDCEGGPVYISEGLNEALVDFGISSNALGYLVQGDDKKEELVSLLRNSEKNTAISAHVFESYGTVRFANIFPSIIHAIRSGAVLVVDELDASLHPTAIMSIIGLFHNNDINVHHAQLIFNTHNPIFLNANLFRRDEIHFVERDDAHVSSHYKLSDFGTAGSSGVRKGEDYMKNYFVERYGAINAVDFAPIFEKLMKGDSEVQQP